jgi:hypothetical protein
MESVLKLCCQPVKAANAALRRRIQSTFYFILVFPEKINMAGEIKFLPPVNGLASAKS